MKGKLCAIDIENINVSVIVKNCSGEILPEDSYELDTSWDEITVQIQNFGFPQGAWKYLTDSAPNAEISEWLEKIKLEMELKGLI